ncbi:MULTISPECIES: general stress protein [Brevibacillus]|uniref:General stress protein n=1 Tax=Brevibacillus laterosporus TaxID=1465 RepID=A0AAP3DGS4_BRELA|nr:MULTISPECIES: general stress protein [Brevibacillus]ATO49437.1 general stress protein [Brevibacillus laterosporus DSM 25]AYB40464.1 general stress protein [Brevibacillus laterosporus]MBG9772287.1 general stress protein [Brevibacillus laterosporus]MBG9787351.1 general stress protein [Brevibacillus laterosporus]MBG9799076.1 general stress protein [Brevibacillus laterosporus]
MVPQVHVVENGVQVKEVIQQFDRLGYAPDHIYVLAHDEKRTHTLAETTEAEEIGVSEEGVFGSIANLFRSRGDELRSKMESLGLSKSEAERYERELDNGRVLVVAKPN